MLLCASWRRKRRRSAGGCALGVILACVPLPHPPLPQTLDKHTNLATALLGAIKSRKLDAWHQVGDEVLCGKADLGAVKGLVSGASGTPADRLRLALIWLLTHDGARPSLFPPPSLFTMQTRGARHHATRPVFRLAPNSSYARTFTRRPRTTDR